MKLGVIGPRREERSRSTKRPESPIEKESQVVQIEASETDDPPTKGESQLAIKDKPPRARPRFDSTEEVGRCAKNCR